MQWVPGGAAPSVTRADSALAADPDADDAATEGAAGEGDVYLQVSSSRNPDWANDLVRQMRSAGLPASLLDPASDGEPYRVVLGPYASRLEADEAGRRLGRAYFIIGGPDSAAAGVEP